MRRAIALAGALLAVVGCTAASGAASPPPRTAAPATAVGGKDGTVSIQPISPPEALPNGCHVYETVLDQILTPPATRVAGSDEVFIGAVVDVGDAQWNTTDSAPPRTKLEYDASHVFRLVRVKVMNSVKGNVGAEVVVAVEGGKIGCTTFVSDVGRRDLAPGQTFMWLAINEGLNANVAPVPFVRALWVVDADGSIRTPVNDGEIKTMSLDEVLKATT